MPPRPPQYDGVIMVGAAAAAQLRVDHEDGHLAGAADVERYGAALEVNRRRSSFRVRLRELASAASSRAGVGRAGSGNAVEVSSV